MAGLGIEKIEFDWVAGTMTIFRGEAAEGRKEKK